MVEKDKQDIIIPVKLVTFNKLIEYVENAIFKEEN